MKPPLKSDLEADIGDDCEREPASHARWIAILVARARYNAAYALYAHVTGAEKEGRSAERLAAILAGQNPADLMRERSLAFDFSYALSRGGLLPEPLSLLAIDTFGQHDTNELTYLVGLYARMPATLNGFTVPVPERE